MMVINAKTFLLFFFFFNMFCFRSIYIFLSLCMFCQCSIVTLWSVTAHAASMGPIKRCVTEYNTALESGS